MPLRVHGTVPLLVLLSGFGYSLGSETLPAWIPDRSSTTTKGGSTPAGAGSPHEQADRGADEREPRDLDVLRHGGLPRLLGESPPTPDRHPPRQNRVRLRDGCKHHAVITARQDQVDNVAGDGLLGDVGVQARTEAAAAQR
ncbi:hypothetical protein AB0B30_31950 [Streptomyces narbonensis]|uniref:Secreted protein n=1 Tax=Streptomyces narbonensis TaxID=67333 RepID=A0ABV3CH18_9ACTN